MYKLIVDEEKLTFLQSPYSKSQLIYAFVEKLLVPQIGLTFVMLNEHRHVAPEHLQVHDTFS